MNATEKAAFAKRVASEQFGPDALELLAKEFPCRPGTRGHSIAFATDGRVTVGKQDRAGEVDGIAMAHHATEHARWFCNRNVQPDAAPKRRGMTDAQWACLRGDV